MLGYSNEARIPFGRPFIKYPHMVQEFLAPNPGNEGLVARMKLMPINDLIKGKRFFCDDSIVRGTQMRETVELLCMQRKEVYPLCLSPIVLG